MDQVFSRYGVPIRLLSDQGPEFESALMAELCRTHGIEKLRTTSYKPSTNGAIERFHRTLNSMLAKVISETQRDWDQHVAPVMAAYRSTIHQSTGYTPNFLVYGRENRAPIDLVLAVEDEPEEVGTSSDVFVQELLQRQRRAYALVREHLGQAAERRKKEYDLHVRIADFKQGDWVYYFYPRRYKGRSPKWSRAYTGPYLITHVIPPCNFVIQKTARSRPIVTHTDKLKKYAGPALESWLPETTMGHPVLQEEEAAEDASSETEGLAEAELLQLDTFPPDARAPDGEGTIETPAIEGPRTGPSPMPAVHLDTAVSILEADKSLPDGRILRDRGRLKKPGRFRD